MVRLIMNQSTMFMYIILHKNFSDLVIEKAGRSYNLLQDPGSCMDIASLTIIYNQTCSD